MHSLAVLGYCLAPVQQHLSCKLLQKYKSISVKVIVKMKVAYFNIYQKNW